MKKRFFKLMLAILGLNVFTACYGPAPIDYPEPEYGVPAPVEESASSADASAAEADGETVQAELQ